MSEAGEYKHITVLLNEAVDTLNIRSGGVYVDGTFGRGGYSRLILSRLGEEGRLIVLDKDPQAIVAARKLVAYDMRVSVVHDELSVFQTTLDELGIGRIDGTLFDLGVSSPQIDEGGHGFSFRLDAPLDMRMNPTHGMSTAEWIATASKQDLNEAIKGHGEEWFSRQIARATITQREESPIDTTRKLVQLMAQNVRTRERGQDPATRTLQAVHIFINRGLEEIEAILPQTTDRLKEDGRLAVIVFHSLEDHVVKQLIEKQSQHAPLPRWVAVKEADLSQSPLRPVGKAVRPSDAEIQASPRSRSAVLHVAERTAGSFNVEGKTV